MKEDPKMFSYRAVKAFKNGRFEDTMDPVVIECRLTINVNGSPYVAIACTPANLPELAAGYLVSEGILRSPSDLKSLTVGNEQVYVETAAPLPKREGGTRTINTCMGSSRRFEELTARDPVEQVAFRAGDLLHMISELNERSNTFRETGGTHIAGLGKAGLLLTSYEDIGRHNAVDKVFGYAFLQQIDLFDCCLVLSGRIAGEILIKAGSSGVPLVLSRSAPTSESIAQAERLGLTIVGFARGERFNIYTHPERVVI